MAEEIFAYIGTYTRGGSEGVYVCRLDMDSGALECVSTAPQVENPSFLDLHPSGQYLYTVNEVSGSSGEKSGGVSAFSVDRETGRLTLLNQQSSEGSGPCHVSVDRTGRYALVANYGSGSVAILPVQEDGRLGEATDAVQHQGSSVDPKRQEGPHAHSINVDPTNQYAFAADLGLDKILIYRIDLEEGKLRPHDPPWVEVAPGAGPRHFAFHPNGRYAYLITEMANTVVAYSYDPEKGALSEIQTLSTLPEGFDDTSYCAEVQVSPDGRFLYGSNRGHDSIAVLSIDEGTGRLSLVDCFPCGGQFPRHFGIDPSGNFLLVANQNSDNVVVFRIDPENGGLSSTGEELRLPAPVCVKFLQR